MDLYCGKLALWSDPGSVVLGLPATARTASAMPDKGIDPIEQMMAVDLVTYLPDDILVKFDRASMAVSLESRVPLLVHRVVEFSWRIPFDYKMREGQSRWPLRGILYRQVPRELVERPRKGFGVPIAEWLRGPLREWAEDLIDERRLRDQGLLRAEPIREGWRSHLAGSSVAHHKLWNILMLQSWLNGREKRGGRIDPPHLSQPKAYASG